MKTKIIVTGLLALFISSCTSPKYLPTSDRIDVNEHGSYIQIVHGTKSYISGELIAIDSNKIVVLSEVRQKCVSVFYALLFFL